MSYYEPQSWQLPARDATWDPQQSSPSRSETTTSTSQRETVGAFNSQLEEVERAVDNLAKSGKLMMGGGRRDSMPMVGGGPPPFNDYSSRMGPMGGRHHSVDFDQGRQQAGSGLQMFYQNQRRPNEVEQMAQAKRRMAAQRERELRNYHQEQQYNRNANPQGKSEGSLSPNSANEQERHDQIARQQRALYTKDNNGSFSEGAAFGDDSHHPRSANPSSGTSSAAGGRGPSPRTFDSFSGPSKASQGQPGRDGSGAFSPSESTNPQLGLKGPSPNPQQQRSRTESTSSPASNPPVQGFGSYELNASQPNRTTASSPGGSPPRHSRNSNPSVAPIGTRPGQIQGHNAPMNKRSGTPSASPLGYNFGGSESLSATTSNNERSMSSASNPTSATRESHVNAWGAPGHGPWGSTSGASNRDNSNNNGTSSSNNNGNGKPSLGVQASVWG